MQRVRFTVKLMSGKQKEQQKTSKALHATSPNLDPFFSPSPSRLTIHQIIEFPKIPSLVQCNVAFCGAPQPSRSAQEAFDPHKNKGIFNIICLRSTITL
jgi:hypothetical protein